MSEHVVAAMRPSQPDSPDADVVAREFPYDGPHSPERTTAALEAVDALVRYACNATSTGGGIGLAPQVYDHLCELTGAVEGLPQLTAQLRRWAFAAADDATIRHDGYRGEADRGRSAGQDTATDVAVHLSEAGQHLRQLADSLNAARAKTAHLCHDLPDHEAPEYDEDEHE